MKNLGISMCLALVGLASCSSSKSELKDLDLGMRDGRGENPGQIMSSKNFVPKKHVEVIVDASGSMGTETDGQKRIDTAKDMLKTLMQTLQEERAAVGITAFGHRKSWSCKDIERVFDMGFKTVEVIEKRFSTINPAERGKTPIAASLTMAHQRLKNIKGPRSILVITDGEETCGGDPCKIAKKLREELDVQIYTLAYDVKNPKEFKSLSCMGDTVLAKDKEEFLDKLTDLKQNMDRDYARKMEGLENVQTLKVLGPQKDAWATAKDINGQEVRFLAQMGTSLPPSTYEVTVHYNPPFVFKDVTLKEKEKKTLVVSGEGTLVLELDFPGVELNAVNMLDSKSYRTMAGQGAKVPIGRYNIHGMTSSGLAFQWQDQIVTPGAMVSLALPNWSLLDVRTQTPVTYDLFAYVDGAKPKTVAKNVFRPGTKSVKQYEDSLGFFTSNAPQVIEPGDYTIILSDGRKIDRLTIVKGEIKVLNP